jgi:hypothetical protein
MFSPIPSAAAQGDRRRRSVTSMTVRAVVPTFAAPTTENQRSG